MGQRIENLTKTFSNPKMRGIFITIFVVFIIALSMGYFRLKMVRTTGVPAEARVTSAPSIASVPGVQQSSSEYVSLQEEQNAQLAAEAERRKTAAIPTVTRPTYLGAGVSASDDSGCSVEELQRARSAGVSVTELRCRGCSLAALKAVDFSVGELIGAGFSIKDLKDAGFIAADLKDAGVDAKDLAKAGFSVRELTQLDCSPAELREAGFSAADLKDAEIRETVTSNEKKCSAEELRKLRARGINVANLDRLQCGATSLKAAGFTAEELRDAGFNAKNLKKAGFTITELKAAGFDAGELKDAEFSAGELKKAGFTADALKDAGFSAKNLRKAGFNPQDMKKAGFSAQDLKDAGLSDGDLIRAGFEERLAEKGTAVQPLQPSTAAAVGGEAREEAAPSVAGGEEEQADWQKQLKGIREQQEQQVSAQEYRDKLSQVQQAMSSQAGDLFAAWMPLPVQQFVQNSETSKESFSQGKGGAEAADGKVANPNADIIKAGSIFFAVLDTGINSDEKSPILATIVGGDLKGAKVLGSFERVNKKVILQFTLLNIADSPASIPLNAVAIDPNTARTALADHVNNHYLLRFGTAFAASFASGVGQAVQNASSSVQIIPSSGEKINIQGSMNATKAALVGLGEVGNKFSSLFASLADTPPTVEVKAGSGIGILLMSDLSVPKKVKQGEAVALSKLEQGKIE